MTSDMTLWKTRDKRDRRSGLDRRCFSYDLHIPERRRKESDHEDNNDRRCGIDRRKNKMFMSNIGLDFSIAG